MIEIEARLDELRALGLDRHTRLISGPQGPHVVLDGKPVLLLCSNNYLGLNVARQPDNGANPRPDNRGGWLDGETPDVVGAALDEPPVPELNVRLWDPASQLRFEHKRAVPPRPDGAPNTGQGRLTREARVRGERSAA